MRINVKSAKGFSFIELIITFLVLIALAAIAAPAYKSYTRRVHFKSVVQVAADYKTGVEECYKISKKLAACNGGQKGVKANITKPKDAVASLTVKAGVITAVPVPHDGFTAVDTYVLTPVVDKDKIVWTTSGGAVARGFAD